MIESYVQKDLFSGMVLLAENYEPGFLRAYGYLNREQQKRNDISDALKIGSIVKDFTAILILQLAEEDELALDDPIQKYIQAFPDTIGNLITIRHLLRHESGLGDYLMNPGTLSRLDSLKNVSNIMDIVSKERPAFDPGTQERYSNSGYTVLGAVIEAVTGISYHQNVEIRILKRLNLDQTLFDWEQIKRLNPLPGYYMRTATGKFLQVTVHEWPSPSGGAYSTVEDLLKLRISLAVDNRLLSDYSKSLMVNNFQDTNMISWNEFKGVSALAGGSPGSNAVIIHDFGRKTIIIVLANYDEPIAEILGNNVYKIIKGESWVGPRISIFETCFNFYHQYGVQYLRENFDQILTEYRFQEDADMVLNKVGYDLLSEDNLRQAIEIFTLNTELFPEIANTWDSLAEGYLRMGDDETALQYYRKSLQLKSRKRKCT